MSSTLWFCLATFVFGFFGVDVNATAPNIIFILADDLGWDDLQFQDTNINQIHTPNIDSLRQQGQFLSYYYGQPLCSPTRSTIMTGAFPLHTGVNTVIKPSFSYGVPLQFKFLPKVLYENGYATHCVGKWHLGYYKWSYTPTFRGFMSYYGYLNGEEDYYTHMRDKYYDFIEFDGIECGEDCYKVAAAAKGEYSAFAFTNRAQEIIANHSKSANKSPLFLYLPFQSVHGPCEAPQSYVNPYKTSINDTKRRNYAGMLSVLDEAVGNITDTLKQNGYLNDNGNTLIVFSSDNGAPVGSCGGYNYPLKGSKSTIWEGGTRLTAFIYGTPDIIPSDLRGKNYSQLMHTVDWYATFLEAAGIDVNKSINHTIDSKSQWKGILGDKNAIGNDKYFAFRDFIWYGYDTSANSFVNYANIGYRYKWNKLINGTGGGNNGHVQPPQCSYESCEYSDVVVNYTLIGAKKSYPILYDLENDPYEYHNITKNNSELVEQLEEMMYDMEATGVPQLQNDTNCPPITHPNSSVGGIWAPWCGK
eukprot:47050_1